MRQWLDEDSRKLEKTFRASAACGSAGSFFQRQFSEWANATGSAAAAAAAEAQANPHAYTSAGTKG